MLTEALRQAWRNLTAHRRRALLTLLSIAVGIFSISAVQIFTYSMEYSIRTRFERFGISTLYVHHFPWKFDGNEEWAKYARRPRVSLRDLEGLQESLKDEAWSAFLYAVFLQKVRYRTQTADLGIRGVSADYVYAAVMELREGRPFRPEELQWGLPVAIIGAAAAQTLFGRASPLGEQVWYAGRPFTVIGVLKAQGFFGDEDRSMIVPLPLLMRVHSLSSYGNIGSDMNILVRAKDPDALPIEILEQRVRQALRHVRHLPPRMEDNFAINRQDALLSQVDSILLYVRLVGWFIAGFALLVGASGVANILYVSVRERQGEIGIQRAMGAQRWFILSLFLTEGVYLAVIGGVVGVGLAGLLVPIGSQVTSQIGLSLQWTGQGVLGAVSLAAVIGLMASLAPAWRAARLHPIEAIRAGA